MGDPEIEAMSSVATTLSGLDESARGRVLRWAAERYGTLGRDVGRSPRGVTGIEADVLVTDEEVAATAPTFEHFAELFAQAQPTSDADRALVAAYWLQVIQGKDQWASRLLNTELKHLGHSLGNVTQALTTNMRKKPQLVIQLRKAGSSQQANKTYKVTNEGIVQVLGMISSGAT